MGTSDVKSAGENGEKVSFTLGKTKNTDEQTIEFAPKTGDTMNVAVWLMLMAVVAVTGGVSVRRRRRA